MAPIAQSAPQPHAAVHDPLTGAGFTLDSSGVAGFFGGDTAVHGMATVNLVPWRKWGGWYNTPGSYEIAKQYGQLASARIFKGLFPGGTDDPSQLFGLNGKAGPKFLATRSGSSFERTGHLAALIMRMARSTKYKGVKKGGAERITTPVTVTVIDLPTVPKETVYPKLSHHHSALLAVIPVGASVGACVGCALVADWWSFSSILLGMFANGCACFVLGSGRLTFKHHEPANGAPRGDGIFVSNNYGVVVLRGDEGAVNCLTRGRFYLEYERSPSPDSITQQSSHKPANSVPAVRCDTTSAGDARDSEDIEKGSRPVDENAERDEQGKDGEKDEGQGDPETDSAPPGGQPNSFGIGLCSVLLTAQFLVQLLLIPQGVLFGQVMFVSTLAVSWGYNTYLSSINREDIQTRILRDILELEEVNVRKFEFGTWTAMSTFACLALQGDPTRPLPDQSSMVWNALLPSTTEVWMKWRAVVNAKMQESKTWEDIQKADYEVGVGPMNEAKRLSQEDQNLLKELLKDAQAAHRRYLEERDLGRG